MAAADKLVRHPLPTSSPAAQGVDAGAIGAFLDRVDSAPDIELHGLAILRHGHVVAAGWWWPYSPDQLHLLYSLSKSFTSTAAGLAVTDGLLNLDAPVVSYFPELGASLTDDRVLAMKVRHIAAMASGHLNDTWDQVKAADDHTEPVRNFLAIPPERDPGSVFAYNQLAMTVGGEGLGHITSDDWRSPGGLRGPLDQLGHGARRRDLPGNPAPPDGDLRDPDPHLRSPVDNRTAP
jgi:CubicO group peptidase (beta-lactamase class C family)